MKQYIKITLSFFLSLILLTSCDDLLDVELEEVLTEEDYLGDDEIDARSALFGVLAQMRDYSLQHVVLNEMRGDLIHSNANTIDDIREMDNLVNINEDNVYADPTLLFSIINNCNFAIEGIDTEAYDNRLQEVHASIVRIRVWAQMQILLNYGKLPYITTPINSDDDFNTKYPVLEFDEALSQLIKDLSPYIPVDNTEDYENSNGFEVLSMIPDNDILLGDLYLWQENYVSAALSYKAFLDNRLDGGPEYVLNTSYSVQVEDLGGSYGIQSSKWSNMFDDTPGSESIMYTAYNPSNSELSPFVFFSDEQFSVSQSIILNWNNQSIGFEGAPAINGDSRTYENSSYDKETLYISKYGFYHYKWYRAAKVYLRYAEAINYAGYPEFALEALNGIFNHAEEDYLPINSIIIDNADAGYTVPEDYLRFDVDDYFTVDGNDNPTGGLLGIRGRASMTPVGTTLFDSIPTVTEILEVDGITKKDTIINVAPDRKDIIVKVGELLLNESALELAFEGNRWEDLVRYSKKTAYNKQNDADTTNDLDRSFIQDAIYNEFLLDGGDASGVSNHLANPENWFLPIGALKLPDHFVTLDQYNASNSISD